MAVKKTAAAAAAAEELAAVKLYMRVDEDADDKVIKAALAAAKVYLTNAGITPDDDTLDLYNLALWSLTLHYYDHRDAVGNEAAFPVGLRPIINQLKLLGAARRAASGG